MVIQQDLWAWALIVLALAVVAGMVVVSLRQTAQRAAERRQHLDLYDRRLAIYMAFHDLLLAAAAKADVLDELHRAAAARAQCRFLLNETIGAMLDDVMTQVLHLRSDAIAAAEGGTGADRAQRARQHMQERVRLLDRIDDLAAAFEPLMKLNEL